MSSELGEAIAAPFGALLRRYRVAAGLTQEEMAERAELCPAATILDGLGVPFTPYEQEAHERAVAAMHAALGEQGFAAAWAAGRALSAEQAVARTSGDAE